MDFDFTEDQNSLRDAVRRYVDKDYGFDQRRAIVKAGGFSREAWNALAGLGLTALAVPEAHGGLGFGPAEAMVVMEELGRGLVMEPYAQGGLVAPAVLAHAGDEVQGDWLPRIAGGDALVVLAHQERKARYRLDVCDTVATADHRLTGAKSVVPAGDAADAFIVPARTSRCTSSRRTRPASRCAGTRCTTARAPRSSRSRTRRPRCWSARTTAWPCWNTPSTSPSPRRRPRRSARWTASSR